MKRKILAFSSSRQGNFGYLETAIPVIREFLGRRHTKAAFVPFASVDDYNEYHNKVAEALEPAGCSITTVNGENATEILAKSECIITGGGNTFKLLHDLYETGCLDIIRKKIWTGTPYIGWSAGANILGASICTTNDMPIIQPQTFEALHVLPFLINPHYYSQKVNGFNGETRDDRLMEFLKLNPQKEVNALPEGSYLKLESGILKYDGISEGYTFRMENGKPMKQLIKAGNVTTITDI